MEQGCCKDWMGCHRPRQQDVPSRHTINVSCHHHCCMHYRRKYTFESIGFLSNLPSPCTQSSWKRGKTGTCPLQLKDEKLKDDNAERPAECFTALRTEPAHTSTLAPRRSWISQRPHWAQFLTSYFRSALETLRLFTFCSMVLHECFFLGFGAFLAVPVSVALPSVRRSKTVHCRGCFGACDWIYQYKLFKL